MEKIMLIFFQFVLKHRSLIDIALEKFRLEF